MPGFVSTQTVQMHTPREGHDLLVRVHLRCVEPAVEEAGYLMGSDPKFEVELIGLGTVEHGFFLNVNLATAVFGSVYDDIIRQAEIEAIESGSF